MPPSRLLRGAIRHLPSATPRPAQPSIAGAGDMGQHPKRDAEWVRRDRLSLYAKASLRKNQGRIINLRRKVEFGKK